MSVASVELLRAAASGDLNRLRALLVQGVDVNSTNNSNQTALMIAAAFKRIEIVDYLVRAGADAKIQDELGLTAADWAQLDTGITRLLNAPPVSAMPKESSARTTHPATTTLGGLAGALLRDHTPINSAFATTAVRATPVITAPVSVANEETGEEPLKRPRPPMSPSVRALVRGGIVVALIVGGFGVYHFVTSVLNTRTASGVKREPAAIPVNAATNVTKSVPVIDGELAGTELFLPDAQYPSDATVASGNVTVGIQVTRKGVVVNVEALDGDESLRSAAEQAAWSSAFAPEKLVNKPSLIAGTITYNFSKPNYSKPKAGVIADEIGSNVSATVGGPLAGAERKLVIPKIPKSVRIEQESATVVVRVTRTGRVMSYRPLDAEERLRAYLIKAARTSTFDPAKLPADGQVVGIITYKFQ
jgi:hypothetical protein